MSEVEFVNGLRVFAPHEGAPDFIIANLVIERAELLAWLQTHPEKVRVDIKRSKAGKLYAAVNNWQPQSGASEIGNQPRPQAATGASKSGKGNPAQPEFTDDDIPF